MVLKIFIFVFTCLSITPQRLTNGARHERSRGKVAVDLPTFREQNLLCHNKNRKNHGVRPVAENDELNDFAQHYAEILAEEDSGLIHSQEGYGENLFSTSNITDGHTACKVWYIQETLYNYTLNKPSPGTGHFSQLIWKKTCSIGVGVATSKSGNTYVVNNYYPPGNIQGGFRENIFPIGTKLLSKDDTSPFEYLMHDDVVCYPDKGTILKNNLECHNILRAHHCAPPLEYSAEMNQYAEEMAEAMAKTNEFQPIDDYNGIVMKYSSKREIGFCRDWYMKGQQYNYSLKTKKDLSMDQKKFVYIVWKNTRYTGFAVAHTKNGDTFVVSLYNPTGNIAGQYTDNVQPPCSSTESIFKCSIAATLTINILIYSFHMYLFK